MPSEDTVLVLTCVDDPTADAVIAELTRAEARVVRLDTGDFPTELRLTAHIAGDAWTGGLGNATEMLDIDRVRSIYYRRPTRFRLPAGMSPADEVFAAVEARHALGGLLASLDVLWVNDPIRTAVAEYKPLQLAVASRCGLRTPRTLVSNVHTTVAEFAALMDGPIVCKPLSSLVFTEDGEQMTKPYTTIIEPHDVDPEAFAATAHLIQEYVPKAYDARVTVVGDLPISVAIHSSSRAGLVDWRADYDSLTYERIDTPNHVAVATGRFLAALGLSYGAFDFVITPSGEWIMLECNPAGQWLWLEHETGAPIAAEVAALLMKGRAT